MTAIDLCFTAHNSFPLSSANAPPYTTVLGMVTSKLLNSWSSPKLTSMQETGAIIAISLRACFLLFANPRPALQRGKTPLKWAIDYNKPDVAAYLRSVGAAQ